MTKGLGHGLALGAGYEGNGCSQLNIMPVRDAHEDNELEGTLKCLRVEDGKRSPFE